ncbi:ComF family protein [Marinobacter sp. S0848L]|uniref:ComF family protein n=1 Tax=Marinobacter sp. S0848L TaxID=2926423 RepID=UPI001FF12AAA|nr:ComF family protein [Marinobacter sp. S0848L]MCK0107028.1 ComF family protein [Marinobacter sp. S0848L]
MINRLKALSTLLDYLVNREATTGRCVTCLSKQALQGLCPPCRADLPHNRLRCETCALPLPFDGPVKHCGECLTQPPPFTRSLIPWRYQFPVDSMIGRYKYLGQRKFARPLLADFSDYLENTLADSELPELLIPAPMHWQRRWRRGFNQSQDIAEYLGQRLGVPVGSRAVQRKRNVRAQRGLNREARLSNLRLVFEVCEPIPERVAIIDDVVTTGATTRALAKALSEAGARDIQIWALARTPG